MRLFAFTLGIAFGLSSVLSVRAADDNSLVTLRHATNATALLEGPDDTNIVKVVAEILQSQHYLRLPLNDELSSRFFDRYLDSLDNLHIYFTKGDLEQFEKYRTHLDEMTLKRGDAAPAREIFNRFREHLEQQYEFVQNALAKESFTFTGDDRFILDRKKLPRPADLAEAKKLWMERLRYEYLQEKLNKEKPADIVKNLTRRYTRILRTLNEYDNDDVLQIYLTALAHVYDPHSDYMGRHELENFNIGMKLSLFGIGALLQSDDGICKIKSLTPGGPAERSKKLKPDDKIVAVAQSNQPPVDVVDMKLNKVVELIRGPKDTEVRLTVIPAEAPDPSARKIVNIIRDEIKLEDQAAKAKIIEMPPRKNPEGRDVSMRVGVIDLPSFYSSFELEGRRNGNNGEQKSTTTDVALLLRKLTQEKVGGIILDLRRNGGGSLEEAINLTGLFIKEGPVVQVKDPDGRVFLDSDPDGSVWYDGPVVVLTSRFSASASEILAGALQDYGRALVVGDSSTHGKGTVQSLLQLSTIMRRVGVLPTADPGAIKYTIRKFYRASGASTQLQGVTPDIVLPSVNSHMDVGESSLDNPLEYDTIPSADYDKVNRVQPFLTELKKRSDDRIGSDVDFAFIRQEVERYKKMKAEKSISLNEEVRLKEKKEADERSKARKKELAARGEPPWKVYDISLKQARMPGLPEPTVRTNTAKSTASTSSSQPAIINKESNKEEVKKPAGQEVANANDEESGETDPDVTAPDITLEETKRILLDYIDLSTKGRGVVLNKQSR
jgi:carboxyl-terminal processing protease